MEHFKGVKQMLVEQDIQDGRNIKAIMEELNDEGKLIICSFAQGALKMQEIYQAREKAGKQSGKNKPDYSLL